MLIFDTLRVKNASYGGNAESLDWALDAHGLLASRGVKNRVAQHLVTDALQTRISGEISTGLSAEDWARQQKIAGSDRENSRQRWAENLASFLICAAAVFILMGIYLLAAEQEARVSQICSSLGLAALCALAWQGWGILLGRFRYPTAFLCMLVIIGAVVLVSPLLMADIGFIFPDGEAFSPWLLIILGLIAGGGVLVITQLDYRAKPAGGTHKLSDNAWKHQAYSYARDKKLTNEAFLNSHIAAAEEAGAAEGRDLVTMCGNPVSYVKNAPQDKTYKPWVEMLTSSIIAAFLLLLALIVGILNHSFIWQVFALAALCALGAWMSYRDYLRVASRS